MSVSGMSNYERLCLDGDAFITGFLLDDPGEMETFPDISEAVDQVAQKTMKEMDEVAAKKARDRKKWSERFADKSQEEIREIKERKKEYDRKRRVVNETPEKKAARLARQTLWNQKRRMHGK